MAGDYEVGYGKPPRHTRFRQGQSGNPKGRPKGTKNLTTDLVEELAESIPIKEGGVTKRVSKQRAMLKRLTEKALQGDTRAANTLLNLALRGEERVAQDNAVGMVESATEPPLPPEDHAILEAFLARHRGPAGGDTDDEA